MDYAERGTVEKTIDRLVEDGTNFADGLDDDLGDLVEKDSFTPEGRAFATGVVCGVLATIRTFSEGDIGLDEEDLSEVSRVTDGRAGELLGVLSVDEE